jgi:predicted HicB family RNase H-like nuclease
MHKPVFDEDAVVRFAALEADHLDAGGHTAVAETCGGGRKTAKKSAATRSELTLMLLPEVVARLRAEAERKGKAVNQVVEKLVNKHLGKH